jgi:hypothetical protein
MVRLRHADLVQPPGQAGEGSRTRMRRLSKSAAPGSDLLRVLAQNDIARLRLANQQITVHSCETPRDVVAALGAMQAQDYRSALWAIGLRSPGSCEADIERAVAGSGVVRTWVLRGTLHFVAATDARWILGLVAPRVIAAGAYRRRQLEIDDSTLARSRELFLDVLSHGRLLTRPEAMSQLESAGITTTGQRGIHILRHLSLEGLLCQAAPQGRQQTFALFEDWVPEGENKDRAGALAELASRYFTSHGPATLRDFAWWSGLTVADARIGMDLAQTGLVREKVGATEYWMSKALTSPGEASRDVYLLPGFDEYVLGYADREIALDAIAAPRIVPGGNGVFRPAIVVDGRAVGTWRLGTRTRGASIVDIFSPLDAPTSDALSRALRDYDDYISGFARTARVEEGNGG